MTTYMPGTRVRVFDSRLFKDDITTPLSMTMRCATVVKWYGRIATDHGNDLVLGPYESLIDVVFDGETEPRCGKFANELYVDILEPAS